MYFTINIVLAFNFLQAIYHMLLSARSTPPLLHKAQEHLEDLPLKPRPKAFHIPQAVTVLLAPEPVRPLRMFKRTFRINWECICKRRLPPRKPPLHVLPLPLSTNLDWKRQDIPLPEPPPYPNSAPGRNNSVVH